MNTLRSSPELPSTLQLLGKRRRQVNTPRTRTPPVQRNGWGASPGGVSGHRLRRGSGCQTRLVAPAKRLAFVAAQLGPKRGKRRALDSLLSIGDLPGGGWEQLDERTWRTGISDAPWAARAREIGSITSWRSFCNRPSNLAIWCQVTPTASTKDALEALALAPQVQLPNLRFHGTVIDEHAEVLGGDAHGQWAHLLHLEDSKGRHSENRIAARVAGCSVCIICCSSTMSPLWSWEEVRALLDVLVQRSDAGVASSGSPAGT